MDNPEEILHSLEEFSKLKPKDIPRELEEYLCFVAKTGDPVYQWSSIKSLFREKLISVITEFYETCPTVEIPPCPNVELFNYDSMKNFILEKLDTFAAAPFTVQRICELLTTPRKEYNRIDKYMRALEKNILVVSTTEPGNRRNTENGDGVVNGLEPEHTNEANNSSNDINVEEMDDTPSWPRIAQSDSIPYHSSENNSIIVEPQTSQNNQLSCQETFVSESRSVETAACSSTSDTVITCRPSDQQPYVSIEPVASDSCSRQENIQDSDVTVTITAIPAIVQNRRSSDESVAYIEPSVAEVSDSSKSESEQKVEPIQPEVEIKEITTPEDPVENVDSSTSALSMPEINTTEANDENQPVPSTSSEVVDESSVLVEKSDEKNVDEIPPVEPVVSSEDISADTTKLNDDSPEDKLDDVIDKPNEDVNLKESTVISSSDEIVNESSTTEVKETKLEDDDDEKEKEKVDSYTEEISVKPSDLVETSEESDKTKEISESVEEPVSVSEEVANSTSNEEGNQIPMEIDDDTTRDTAILAPNCNV